MNLKGVFIRFALLYVLATIVAGSVVNYFNIKNISWLNIVILLGLTMYLGESFAKKNGRYYSSAEQLKIILGFIIISISIQLFFAFAALNSSGKPLNFSVIGIAIGITLFLHSLAIIIFVKATRKRLIKRGVIND